MVTDPGFSVWVELGITWGLRNRPRPGAQPQGSSCICVVRNPGTGMFSTTKVSLLCRGDSRTYESHSSWRGWPISPGKLNRFIDGLICQPPFHKCVTGEEGVASTAGICGEPGPYSQPAVGAGTRCQGPHAPLGYRHEQSTSGPESSLMKQMQWQPCPEGLHRTFQTQDTLLPSCPMAASTTMLPPTGASGFQAPAASVRASQDPMHWPFRDGLAAPVSQGSWGASWGSWLNDEVGPERAQWVQGCIPIFPCCSVIGWCLCLRILPGHKAPEGHHAWGPPTPPILTCIPTFTCSHTHTHTEASGHTDHPHFPGCAPLLPEFTQLEDPCLEVWEDVVTSSLARPGLRGPVQSLASWGLHPQCLGAHPGTGTEASILEPLSNRHEQPRGEGTSPGDRRPGSPTLSRGREQAPTFLRECLR